jgi:NADH dehydrogenase (ubiquinone) 1 beta subcomplex subunit 2
MENYYIIFVLSSSYNYRAGPSYEAYPARVKYGAFAVGGFMWWWVLWHLWHEPEHITGEWPQPDPLLWTDKELGIPPDDYDEEV